MTLAAPRLQRARAIELRATWREAMRDGDTLAQNGAPLADACESWEFGWRVLGIVLASTARNVGRVVLPSTSFAAGRVVRLRAGLRSGRDV
jgi:hypothetical protein